MKYAVMSDVHSNPRALETALADARRLGCGKFIFLGDISGYGYDVKGALRLVQNNFDVVLMGNHDAVCAGLNEDPRHRNANYDIDRAQGKTLSEEDISWLGNLKLIYKGQSFYGVHGDYFNPGSWGYIISPQEAAASFAVTDKSLLFCGHSHHAEVWVMDENMVIGKKFESRLNRVPADEETIPLVLSRKKRYIVNVGSVGYPRCDGCSTYAIYDSVAQCVTLRRLPFDFDEYVKLMIANMVYLPQWLCDLVAAARKMG